MKLELKNIKVHLGLSHETHAFTANLYVDGKKTLEISNDGQGGADYQDEVADLSVREINNWCKANLPTWWLSEIGGTRSVDEEFETNLETWCHEQVNKDLMRKEYLKLARSKVVFIDDDQVFTQSFKGVKKYQPQMSDTCLKMYPNAVVLNRLVVDEAVELFREYSK